MIDYSLLACGRVGRPPNPTGAYQQSTAIRTVETHDDHNTTTIIFKDKDTSHFISFRLYLL